MSEHAQRRIARLKNNCAGKSGLRKNDEYHIHEELSKQSERIWEKSEYNKPSFYANQNANQANFAMDLLGTLALGFCAYAATKEKQNSSLMQPIFQEDHFHQMIQQNGSQEVADANNLCASIKDQLELCIDCGFATQHLKERLQTLDSIACTKVDYSYQNHQLSAPVENLITQYGFSKNVYATCYGNQLQQQVHKECLLVLEYTAALSISSPLYEYKSELIGFTDSARAYNQLGLSCKAMSVLDVCWAFFDYGKAIVEGLAAGALDVAQGIIDHPFQTALCVVAGEYVLAYCLSKMLVEVAQIGLISCIDPQAGSDHWNDYIEPLTQTINAIENQELTVRNCLKTASYCAASCFTQHKVLCVSGNLYQKAKNRVLEFVQKNPLFTPVDYAATGDGLMLKAVGSVDTKKSVKSIAEYVGAREIVLPKVKTYEQARNQALKIIGKVDSHTATPHLGHLGVGKDKIVGTNWHGNKVRLRLDYDLAKGAHINVNDYRIGKGNLGNTFVIPFEGTQQTVENLLNYLNTLPSLERAKNIFSKIEDSKSKMRIIETVKNLKSGD